MNKSNHPSINNYLTNASLFRSNQKNRFVSSYITHKNYFEKDQQSNHPMHVLNVTKSKKQYQFMPNDSFQNMPIQENKTDALEATIKKDGKNEDPLPDMSAKLLEQLIKQNAQSSIQKQSEVMVIESQARDEKSDSIPSNNSKSIFNRPLNQSGPSIASKSSTKFMVNLTKPPSQKEKNIKSQQDMVESVESHPSKYSKLSSYLNIRQQEMMYTKNKPQYQQNAKKNEGNPYLPSSHKKQELNIYQTDNGEVTLKKIQSNSINPASSIHGQSPMSALFLTHSSIDRRKESQADHEMDYFQNIKKDISGYLASIKQKLNGSYLCLETIQYQFDVLIDKTLQLECEKLKDVLYRLVEQQINDFKQFQRRQFSKKKFYFMSDLFQIKCNIDLRLQQIQQYQLQLKDSYKWKNSINSIIGVDYHQNINFILKKSDQIQKDTLADISINLNDYVKVVNEEVTRNMKKQIKDIFTKIYDRFHQVRSKKKIFLQSSSPDKFSKQS